MRLRSLIGLALIVAFTLPALAEAQGRRGGRAPVSSSILNHRFEIHGFYGYKWTWSRRVQVGLRTGNADIKDSGMWGGQLDFNLGQGRQVSLVYTQQDSKIDFNPDAGPKEDVSDVTVREYQIGGLAGVPQGNILPYGSFTLGLTHFSPSNPRPGYAALESTTRFSVIPGLGVKIYAGERVIIRGQARLPIAFFGGGVGFGCGGGGCGTTIGGYGLTQFDLSGGIGLRF